MAFYRITNPHGEVQEHVSEEEVQEFANALVEAGITDPDSAGFVLEPEVERTNDLSRTANHGIKAQVAPYYYDVVDREGENAPLRNKIVALAKDAGSYLTRLAKSNSPLKLFGENPYVYMLENQLKNTLGIESTPMGVTSEESEGTVDKIMRSPYTLPSMSAFNLANSAKIPAMSKLDINLGLGGVLGAAENLTEQPGYESGMTPEQSAGLGIAFSVAGEGLSKALSPKVMNTIKAALREKGMQAIDDTFLMALANRAFRGGGSRPLVSVEETKKLIESNPALMEELIRNATPEDLHAMANKYSNLADNSISKTPIVAEGMDEPGKMYKYKSLSTEYLAKQLSPEERRLIEQSSANEADFIEKLKLAEKAKAEGREITSTIFSQNQVMNREEALRQARRRLNQAKETYDRALRTNEIKVVEGDQKDLIERLEEKNLAEQNMRQANRDAENAVYEGLGLKPKKGRLVQSHPTNVTENAPTAVQYLTDIKKPEVPGEMSAVQSNRAWEYQARKNLEDATKYLEKIEGMSAEDFEGSVGQDFLDKLNKTIEALELDARNAKDKFNESKVLVKGAKETRGANRANGMDTLVPETNNSGVKVYTPTNKLSEQFQNDFAKNLQIASADMASNWKTVGGRLRRKANGDIYIANPKMLDKRAEEYINKFYNIAESASRFKSLSGIVDNKMVSVANEDVMNVLREMAQRNEWEFMDALLMSCKWIDEGQKVLMKQSAMGEKAATEALRSYNTPIGFHTQAEGSIDDIALVNYLKSKVPIPFRIVSMPSKEGKGLSPSMRQNHYDLQKMRGYKNIPWGHDFNVSPLGESARQTVNLYGRNGNK